jgi:cytochrome c5
MARALIITLAAISLMGASCQTTERRIEAAARAKAEAETETPRPSAPEACVGHIERVVPKVGEKARWTQKRWEIVADNRDRQADDCGAWIDAIFDVDGKG